MPTATPAPSAALGLSQVLLHLLRILNGVMGLLLVLFFLLSFVFEPQVLAFFSKRPPTIDPGWLMPILRVWIVLALPLVAAMHVLFSRLLVVVASVGAGDPFVPENARHLHTIAWCLLATQVLHLVFGLLASLLNAAGSKVDWEFSMDGWLAVLLLFVLAQVFEAGTRMRAELEGTV